MDERTNENYSDDAAFKRDREQNKQTPTPFIRPMSSGQFGVVAKISLVAHKCNERKLLSFCEISDPGWLNI